MARKMSIMTQQDHSRRRVSRALETDVPSLLDMSNKNFEDQFVSGDVVPPSIPRGDTPRIRRGRLAALPFNSNCALSSRREQALPAIETRSAHSHTVSPLPALQSSARKPQQVPFGGSRLSASEHRVSPPVPTPRGSEHQPMRSAMVSPISTALKQKLLPVAPSPSALEHQPVRLSEVAARSSAPEQQPLEPPSIPPRSSVADPKGLASCPSQSAFLVSHLLSDDTDSTVCAANSLTSHSPQAKRRSSLAQLQRLKSLHRVMGDESGSTVTELVDLPDEDDNESAEDKYWKALWELNKNVMRQAEVPQRSDTLVNFLGPSFPADPMSSSYL
jgi:hypothetical protein